MTGRRRGRAHGRPAMGQTRRAVREPRPLYRHVAPWALAACVGATASVLLVGPAAPEPAVFVALAVAFCALATLLVAEGRTPRLGTVPVAASAALLLALAVAVPPVMSRDLWSYAAYGRIVVAHHASPYVRVPADYPHDPLVARVAHGWRRTPSVYGPAFTGLSALGMRAAGTNPTAARLFFQLLAAAAVAAGLVLTHRHARDPRALAAVGCNPVVVVAVVNAGHNDALVGLALVGAVAAASRRRWSAAGALVGAAALVKVTALVGMVGLALWLAGAVGMRRALGAVVACGLVVVAGYALGGGWTALRPLEEARLRTSGASPWNPLRVELTRDRIEDGERGVVAGRRVREDLSRLSALAVGVLATVVALRHRRDPTPALAVGGSLLAFTLCGTYVLAWYVAPVVMVGHLAWRSRVTTLALAQGSLLELAYVPDFRLGAAGLHRPGILEQLPLILRTRWLPVFEVVAVVVLVAGSLRRRPRPPGRVALPAGA